MICFDSSQHRLEDSIVLIGANSFGTGFVIHQDSIASYVLTCHHVVDKATDKITVDNVDAQIILSGADQHIDLAVLRVEGFYNRPVFSLQLFECKDVVTAGFQSYRNGGHLARTLDGKLGKTTQIRFEGARIQTWDLEIDDRYQIQRGYSGSPVIDSKTDRVVGVASDRDRESGENAVVIKIEALRSIWASWLPDLFILEAKSDLGYLDGIQTHSTVKELVILTSYLMKQFDDSRYLDHQIHLEAMARASIGRYFFERQEFDKACLELLAALDLVLPSVDKILSWHELMETDISGRDSKFLDYLAQLTGTFG